MKKIFKKLFSVERIDLIKQYLNKKNPISLGDWCASWRLLKKVIFEF
jgi:hypothetical protein